MVCAIALALSGEPQHNRLCISTRWRGDSEARRMGCLRTYAPLGRKVLEAGNHGVAHIPCWRRAGAAVGDGEDPLAMACLAAVANQAAFTTHLAEVRTVRA